MTEEQVSAIDYREYREKKINQKDFDLKILCNNVVIEAHSVVLSAKSEYIKGVIQYGDKIKKISLNEIEPVILQKVVSLFYEFEEKVDNSDLSSVVVVADFLLSQQVLDHVNDLINNRFKELPEDIIKELFSTLKKISNGSLKHNLFKNISKNIPQYSYILKELNLSDWEELLTNFSLIIQDSNKCVLLSNEYTDDINKLIESREKDTTHLKDFCARLFEARRLEHLPTLFCGLPTRKMLANKVYGVHPEEYHRLEDEKISIEAPDPFNWHLKKLTFFIMTRWNDLSNVVANVECEYVNRKSNQVISSEPRRFSRYDKVEVILDDDEFITWIHCNHGYIIDRIIMRTNKGREFTAGQSEGGSTTTFFCNEIKDQEDVYAVGLFGFKTNYLYSSGEVFNDIQFIFSGIQRDLVE